MSHFQAKKSLGQNFLKSKKALRAMVEAGEVKAGDTVVEIGPGKGALTQVLLETGATVIAFEKDHRLIDLLSVQFASFIEEGKFFLHEKDILDVEISEYVPGSPIKSGMTGTSSRMTAVSSGKTDTRAYKLIANIPYYITGEITRRFLSGAHKPTHMILLVQKEVAERITDSKETILSLSVKAFGTPKKVMTVKKEYFSPSPKVDSAIIKITDIHNPFATVGDELRFFTIIKKAFGQKRKKINSTLKEFKDELQDWEEIKEKRPEDLDITKWLVVCKKS